MLRNTQFGNVSVVVATLYVLSNACNASNASSTSYISVSVQYMVFAPALRASPSAIGAARVVLVERARLVTCASVPAQCWPVARGVEHVLVEPLARRIGQRAAEKRKRRRAELLFASHRESSWWLNRSPVEVLGPHDRVVVVRGRERIDVAVAFEVDPTYRARLAAAV